MRNVFHVIEESLNTLTDNFNQDCLFVVACANKLDGKMAFQPRLTKRKTKMMGTVCFMCDVHKLREDLDNEEVQKLCRACAKADVRLSKVSKNPQLNYMHRQW